MKSGLCLLFVIFLSKSALGIKNTIYVNILPLLLGNVNVNYERALTPKISAMIGGYYWSFTLREFDFTSTAIKAGIGFYPAGNALRGFYFLPNYVHSIFGITHKPSGEKGVTTGSTISFEVGHRWIWKGGVTFDLSIGGGIRKAETMVGDAKFSMSVTGLTHVGIQFGYSW